MTTYAIGTVFKRRTPQKNSTDEIVITGGGSSLVVTSNTEFETPFTLNFKQLREDYLNLDGTELEEPELQTPDNQMTPEQVFASVERKRLAEGIEPTPKRGGRRGVTKSID